MARQYNNQKSNNSEWFTIDEGVSIKKGKENRISINWFGAVIHGVKIVNGKNGAFISWPSFKNDRGEYIKTAYVFAQRGSIDEQILNAIVDYCVDGK